MKSRRALLARSILAATAVVSTTTVTLPDITSGTDADLIALGADLQKAWNMERAIEESGSDDAVKAACAACSAIANQIEKLTATTIAGLRVKVLALSWTHSGEPFDAGFFGEAGTSTDYRLTMGIIRDIIAAEALS